jgi:hypothetical protein
VANALGELITSEVTRAEADYQNVRSRALSIVAVAGGLVTLLSGLLTIAAGSKAHLLSLAGRWVLGCALIAYVLAAISALIVNVPSEVDAPTPEALGTLVESNWDDDGWDKSVATVLTTYLGSLVNANKSKNRWLIAAIVCEIAGIAFTAVLAILIVQHLN